MSYIVLMDDARKKRAALPWYRAGGAPAPVAVYQPLGAASLAASYVNLVNPGVNDAAPGVAPIFNSALGWTFNGSTEYLTTGITPASGWSVVARFSDMGVTGVNDIDVIGEVAANANFDVTPRSATLGNVRRYRSGANNNLPGAYVLGGVMAMGGGACYLNASADGTFVESWTGVGTTLYIGARNTAGTANNFYPGRIQAIAVYSSTPTGGQLAAVSAAVAALRFDADPLLTLAPTGDTFLQSAGADTNFGTQTYLQIGESSTESPGYYRGLVNFSLSGVPVGATVISAALRLKLILNGNARATGLGILIAYPCLRAWTELGATHNKYDGVNAWQTAGGTGALDAEAPGVGGCTFTTTDIIGMTRTIYLTPAAIQRWVDGTLANRGLYLRMATETDDAYRLGSRENSGNEPSLTLIYAASLTGASQITFSGDSKSNWNDGWPCVLLDSLRAASGAVWYENPGRLAVAGYAVSDLHTYVDANIGALTGNPQAVLLNIGANDLATGTLEAPFKADLAGVIDAYLAQFPTTTVYVAYPWITGKDAEALVMKGWIDAVIAGYGSGVAAGHNENVWYKPNVAAYSYDGTHYNDLGTLACAAQWQTILGY